MSRRIKIILFAMSFFASFSNVDKVNATETCETSPSLSYAGSRAVQTSFRHSSRPILRFKINGKIGFCLDEGKEFQSGATVVENGCDSSSISTRMKQALNYCDSAGGCDDLHYVIAQVYAWNGSKVDAAQAYCSYNGKNASINPQSSCVLQQLGSDSETQKIYKAVSSASTAGDFICWQPKRTGNQRLASKGTSQCNLVCPEGTAEAGKDITEAVEKLGYDKAVEQECGGEIGECYGNQIGVSGAMPSCENDNYSNLAYFSETVLGAATSADGSINGRRVDKVIGSGKYCSVYCLEVSATISLPGGLANPIRKGGGIVWPTYSNGSEGEQLSPFGNMFPLIFNGHKKCVIQVAPNLTYGNSCNINPVDEYSELLKTLDGMKNENKNASTEATDANSYISGHAGSATGLKTLTAVSNVSDLSKTNEQIRYASQACKTVDFTETCADASYFKSYLDRKENKAKADYNYKKVWEAYCDGVGDITADSSTTCSGGSTPTNGSCPSGETATTTYSCPDGSQAKAGDNTKCVCNETYANNKDPDNTGWWKTAISKWEAYNNAIDSKYTKFKNYIKAYRAVVDLYQEIKYCADVTLECEGDSCEVYNFQTSAELSYEYADNDLRGSSYLIERESVDYTCDKCAEKVPMTEVLDVVKKGYTDFVGNEGTTTYLQNRINDIEKKEVHIYTGDVKYGLKDGLFNYLNKDTGEYSNEKPANANYIKLGYSILPTSFDNVPGYKYDLILQNLSLGDNGQFKQGLLESPQSGETAPYICNYTVGADSECLCPPGTKHAGIDLYGALYNSNLTCADAQLKYCDGDNVPKCDVNCEEEKYCPNDRSIKITSCVNSGKTKETCVELLCNQNKKQYQCPSGTTYKEQDISACVYTRMSQNISEAAAVKYCENTLCNGNLFIYRTIDLKNPFPSIDADTTNSQGITHHGFNQDRFGRYPGTNWNSVELVKKKIFKNAGVDDYDVYNQKPLYHFELDTATILKIREYNKKQKTNDDGYNDFTLTCDQTENSSSLGRLCYSTFIHDATYGGDVNGQKSKCGDVKGTAGLATCTQES